MVKFINEFWRKIVIAIQVSAGAIAELIAIGLIFGLKLSFWFIIIAIALPLVVYLFDFFEDSNDNSGYFLSGTKNKKILFVIGALSLVSIAITIIWGNAASLALLILILLLGFLYTLKFKKMTKYITGFKDVYVAINWNLYVVLLFLFNSFPVGVSVVVFLAFVFFRDLMNIIFYDLKDLKHDKEQSLCTLPSELGVTNTFLFLHLLNIISGLILIAGRVLGYLPLLSIALLIPVILSSVVLVYAKYKKAYTTTWIDIEYFIWLLSVFLSSKLT